MAYTVDYTPLTQASGRRAQTMAGLGGVIGGVVGGGLESKRQRKFQGLAREALGGDPAAQEELSIVAPEINAQVMQQLGARSEQQQKGMIYDFAHASSLHKAGNPEEALKYLDQRVAMIDARGGDSQHTRQIRDIYAQNPEQGSQVMGQALLRMMDPKGFAKSLTPGVEGETKIGAQEILEDGTIIQSTARGPVVYNPEGKKVRGKAAAEAVKMARAEKVSNLRIAAGEKKRAALESELDLKGQVESGVITAKEAAKISVKAFERLENINTNIANIDEGIMLLDEESPAATGFVEKMMPSIRKNSVKLDNLQGRLGLDVLHSTTFGALSAAELKFALSTALPTGLKGPELRKWLVAKKESQEKLADYIEASAIYLGTPGNTVAGWVKKQRDKRLAEQEGAVLYQEGQTATGPGGERMVFTNGKWEAM